MRILVPMLALAATISVGCATTTGTPDAAQTPPPSGPAQVDESRQGSVPVGQEIDVRLQTSLGSGTSQAEDRFEATTVVDLMQGDRVLVPAGSVVRGVVRQAEAAGRMDRTGRLTLAFDQITVRGRQHQIRATATQVFESRGIEGEAAKIGTAAGVGAIVGGILGGMKGALAGVLIGGGGVIAATEGQDVTLPAGTIVRLRLDTPVHVR